MATWQQVVDRARSPLNDPKKGTPPDGVRWKDAVLLEYGVDCARRLTRTRPDLFIGQFTAMPSFSAHTLASTFPFGDDYIEPVCDYIRSRAHSHDTEDAEDGRIALFAKAFAGVEG